ncbi:coiled-coil domain-containing protein 96-like [Lacerta agilis]|uniref:coiled-coil domain-containing protein 96-like n=1 Tax=Lacerta agilis TaxID=80427 RepID=UPI001419FA0F|nr:coiled-coil domain-containing protein 96-like [Lacerta agilis]
MKSGGLLLLVGSLVLWTALLAAPHGETPRRASLAPRCAQTEATPECKEGSGRKAEVMKDEELAQNNPVSEELQGAALMEPVSHEKSASGEATGKPRSKAGRVTNDGPAASGGQPGNGEAARAAVELSRLPSGERLAKLARPPPLEELDDRDDDDDDDRDDDDEDKADDDDDDDELDEEDFGPSKFLPTEF